MGFPTICRGFILKDLGTGQIHQLTWLFYHLHVAESFSYKEVQFKTFCSSVKTSCNPLEIVNEPPEFGAQNWLNSVSYKGSLPLSQTSEM